MSTHHDASFGVALLLAQTAEILSQKFHLDLHTTFDVILYLFIMVLGVSVLSNAKGDRMRILIGWLVIVVINLLFLLQYLTSLGVL